MKPKQYHKASFLTANGRVEIEVGGGLSHDRFKQNYKSWDGTAHISELEVRRVSSNKEAEIQIEIKLIEISKSGRMSKKSGSLLLPSDAAQAFIDAVSQFKP